MSYYSETKISKKSYFWVKKIRITKKTLRDTDSSFFLPFYIFFTQSSLEKRFLVENILKTLKGLIGWWRNPPPKVVFCGIFFYFSYLGQIL